MAEPPAGRPPDLGVKVRVLLISALTVTALAGCGGPDLDTAEGTAEAFFNRIIDDDNEGACDLVGADHQEDASEIFGSSFGDPEGVSCIETATAVSESNRILLGEIGIEGAEEGSDGRTLIAVRAAVGVYEVALEQEEGVWRIQEIN